MQRFVRRWTLVLVGALAVGSARADIHWRVSVKFILGPGGARPCCDFTTNADVAAQIQRGNDALKATGRGYSLDLIEIVDVAGLEEFFNIDARDSDNRGTLELIVRFGPPSFGWRDDAINMYVNNSTNSAVCAFPDEGSLLLFGQGLRDESFIHESGHYFGLCHTQGCECAACDDDQGPCTEPGDDEIDDTLPDVECWDQDDIAQYGFGLPYDVLPPSWQDLVDDVFFNMMSYHDTRERFTQNQMDQMTLFSNLDRHAVATGTTYFVYPGGAVPWCEDGSLYCPFDSIMAGVNSADAGDIVLIQNGVYFGDYFIITPCELRARAGQVMILGSQP